MCESPRSPRMMTISMCGKAKKSAVKDGKRGGKSSKWGKAKGDWAKFDGINS